MNSKTIIKLLVALAVLGGIAWFTNRDTSSSENNNDTGLKTGDVILEDLDLNEVKAIAISKGEESTTVAMKEDKWVVDSMSDYPADFDKIRDNLMSWSEVKVGDLPRGGSVDEYGLGTNATTVVMNDASGSALTTIKVGAPRPRQGSQFGGNDGHYIKVDDGPVILTDADFSALPSANTDWTQTDFVNVPSADIIEVSIQGTNGTVTLDTRNQSAYVVNNLGEDEETNVANAGRAHRALQNLSFDDVADTSMDDGALGLEKPIVFTAKTKEEVTYTVQIGKEAADGDHYARVSASYTAPPAPTREMADKQVPADEPKKEDEAAKEGEAAKEESPAEPAAAPEKTREQKVDDKLAELTKAHEAAVTAAQAKVDELADRKDWVYVLGALDVEPLMFIRADLVSKKATEEKEDESANNVPMPRPPTTPSPVKPPQAPKPASVTTPPVKVAPAKPKPSGDAPKTVTSAPVKVEPPQQKPKPITVTTPPVEIKAPEKANDAKPALPPSPPGVEPTKEKAVDAATEKAVDAAKDAGKAAQENLKQGTEKLKLKVNEGDKPE